MTDLTSEEKKLCNEKTNHHHEVNTSKIEKKQFSTFYWLFLDSSERFVHRRILLLHSICHSNLYSFIEELMTDKKFMNLAKDFAALKLVLN